MTATGEPDIVLSHEIHHDILDLRVMKALGGNPLRVSIDRRTGMIQFVQRNDEVTDEVHLHLQTFVAIIKALQIEPALGGLYELKELGS